MGGGLLLPKLYKDAPAKPQKFEILYQFFVQLATH